MAKTVAGTVKSSIQYTYEKTGDAGLTRQQLTFENKNSYAGGTGPNKGNLLFRQSYSIASSGTQSLDLFGSLTDPFGDTVNFETINFVCVRNLATTAGENIAFGKASADDAFEWMFDGGASAEKIRIGPKGCFLWDSPITGNPVTFENEGAEIDNQGAGTITVEILIAGDSGTMYQSSSSSSTSTLSSSSSSSSQSSSSSVSESSSTGSSLSSSSSSSSLGVSSSSSSSSSQTSQSQDVSSSSSSTSSLSSSSSISSQG